MQLPVGAALLFLLIFVSIVVYRRVFLCIRKRNSLLSRANGLIGMFLVMFYFLYLYLTRTIFDIFNCAPTEPPDGHDYLSVSFVRCGTGFQVGFSVFVSVVYRA